MGWERIKGDIVTAYMETFSEDEIKAMSAFYKTPAGQAFIQKMPQLMKKTFEISQKRMPEMLSRMKQMTAEMVQEMRDEIEKKRARESKKTDAGRI